MKSLLNQMPKGGSPVREIRSPGSVQGVPLALIERSSREVSLLGPQPLFARRLRWCAIQYGVDMMIVSYSFLILYFYHARYSGMIAK